MLKQALLPLHVQLSVELTASDIEQTIVKYTHLYGFDPLCFAVRCTLSPCQERKLIFMLFPPFCVIPHGLELAEREQRGGGRSQPTYSLQQ